MACLLAVSSMSSSMFSFIKRPSSWILCLFLVIDVSTSSAKLDSLREVTDSSWEEILSGEWMIEFYAPWCPACQQLQTVWKDFADWGDDMGVNIAKLLVFIADFAFPSRRFSSSDYYQKKQTLEQARLIQRQEDEHEADGEEEEDEDEEDEEQDEVWRRRRRGSPEGLPDEALRKRVVGTREQQDDEEDDDS
ncbi:hypothetical protein F7725_008406 [Dissostichus mawsoni]|uniref:Thioredoxin domain-containing protein n=1 Tax=Dissostichus mawsoni TaxID=36200 RepID=A0A7J5Y801_DISMA|nr:hypothetical protein F7725_008406 [Dissostichus mawsoni]